MRISYRVIAISIITFLLTSAFVINSSASTYEHTDTDEYSTELTDYLPDTLAETYMNHADLFIDNTPNNLISHLITNDIIDNIIINKHFLSILAIILLLSAIFSQITPSRFSSSFVFLTTLSTITTIIISSHQFISLTRNNINNLSNLSSTIAPCLSSIFLLSGSNISAITSTASLSLILSIFEQILLPFLNSFSVITFGIFITENIYPPLKGMNITKALKKNLISVIIFSFSFLLALIALNGSLAASKDSVSLRGIKFATSSIIPVIGSSVSEAMKTLISGVTGLRNTLGLLSAYAILSTSLPCFVSLFIFKLSLRFLGICASLLSLGDTSPIFDGAADIVDIILALLTAATVTTFFTLFIFTNLITFN